MCSTSTAPRFPTPGAPSSPPRSTAARCLRSRSSSLMVSLRATGRSKRCVRHSHGLREAQPPDFSWTRAVRCPYTHTRPTPRTRHRAAAHMLTHAHSLTRMLARFAAVSRTLALRMAPVEVSFRPSIRWHFISPNSPRVFSFVSPARPRFFEFCVRLLYLAGL